MSGRRKDTHATGDRRWFVQMTRDPSLGIDVSTGQAWVGVDQQVGHFSADALFALTTEQYEGVARPRAAVDPDERVLAGRSSRPAALPPQWRIRASATLVGPAEPDDRVTGGR